MKIRPGQPYPLGATWDGAGVNFALFSEHATKVELCLFDTAESTREATASRCPSRPTWSGTATCPTCSPASSTATASTARTSPAKGHRFNRNKVVLDPYAKAIGRDVRWDDSLFGYTIGDPDGGPVVRRPRQRRVRAAGRRSIDPAFTWGDDRPPRTPWHKTLIYELHVKGFTKLHPGRAREAARHLRRPRRPKPAIEHLHDARRHRRRAAAGPPPRRRPPPASSTGLTQLLGLQHARLLRPGPALRVARGAARRGAASSR